MTNIYRIPYHGTKLLFAKDGRTKYVVHGMAKDHLMYQTCEPLHFVYTSLQEAKDKFKELKQHPDLNWLRLESCDARRNWQTLDEVEVDRQKTLCHGGICETA
jgi:hypothetical protein